MVHKHQNNHAILSLLDFTSLNQTDSIKSISAFIKKANTSVNQQLPAAVCVYPKYAELLTEQLNSKIKSCVVSTYFPSSQAPLVLKVQEIQYLNQTSIDEIDIVISVGELLDGNDNYVRQELTAIRSATKKTLKVILETGTLKSPEMIKKAAKIAMETGADFLKTSTGKEKTGATIEAVEILAEEIRQYYIKTQKRIGLKIAGGIRTKREAELYIGKVIDILGKDWISPDTFRIGASSLYNHLILHS